MSRFLLVRHGRTAWHADGRYAGTSDVPLDELGMEQGRRVVGLLSGEKLECIYSSPLSRCLQLATMVAEDHGMEVVVDERLREIDLGRWDGMMLSEIVEVDGEILKQWTSDPTSVVIPGGESLSDVQERAMDWLRETASAYPDGNILASSHGGPIRAIIAGVLDLSLSRLFRLTVDLASLSVANYKGRFSNLECMNDRYHLDGIEDGTLL